MTTDSNPNPSPDPNPDPDPDPDPDPNPNPNPNPNQAAEWLANTTKGAALDTEARRMPHHAALTASP